MNPLNSTTASVIVSETMPADEYHRDPAPSPSLNSSIAKILDSQSPLHAWTAHPRLNPNFREEEREIFDLGSAAHSLFLEGVNIMVEMPFDDWRTKAAREQRDLVRAQGKLPVLSKHFGSVIKMVDISRKALRESELEIDMENCQTERTVIWQGAGIWKRARLDATWNPKHLILDYKTTESADPWAFQRQIVPLGYDIQAAHYTEAYRRATPTCDRDPPFVFLVQERSEPFACSLIAVDPLLLDLGQQKMARSSEIWRHCLTSGKWPSYPKKVFWAEAPAWAIAQFQQRSLGE